MMPAITATNSTQPVLVLPFLGLQYQDECEVLVTQSGSLTVLLGYLVKSDSASHPSPAQYTMQFILKVVSNADTQTFFYDWHLH